MATFGAFLDGRATADGGAPGGGLERHAPRRRAAARTERPVFDGLLKIALAEAEARAGDPGRAIAILGEALATCHRLGYRAFEAELHRVRGEILFKRDPANPAPAEEAFQAALAVAQQQAARSFELRAALALANLYRVDRPPRRRPRRPRARARRLRADAGDARNRGGASAAHRARRQRRGQGGRGAAAATHAVASGLRQRAHRCASPGAPETTEAFARARQGTPGEKEAPERVAADFGLWLGSYFRGDLPSMRTHAEAFLRDVEARPDSPEAGVAHRAQGINHHFAGDYVEAQRHLERALALFEPGRDDDLTYRFGVDVGVPAMALLAFASWPLGEVDRAISLIDRMTRSRRDPRPIHARVRRRLRCLVRTVARRRLARRAERRRAQPPRGRTRSADVARVRTLSSNACATDAKRRARGHAPRRRTLARAERSDFRWADQDCAGRSRSACRRSPTAPSQFSTERWRRQTGSAIALSTRNCIGRAAKSC